MNNLFKIEFVQGKTNAADYGAIKHALVDTAIDRKLITLSLSADKLQSVSYFAREPKRLEFECFIDDWIQAHILSGGEEHERYISHYEVKAYRDNALIFTGIIDTSNLSYDVADGIVKFMCYDKLKLLSIYSDLQHLYSQTSGYYNYSALQIHLSAIMARIPISVTMVNGLLTPDLAVDIDDYVSLGRIDYADMLQIPANTSIWSYTHDYVNGWANPKYGYRVDSLSGIVWFVFTYIHTTMAVNSTDDRRYRSIYRFRLIKLFNKICSVVEEIDEFTDWKDDVALDNTEFIRKTSQYGLSEASLNSLATTATMYGGAYIVGHNIGSYVEPKFYGLLYPQRIHFGEHVNPTPINIMDTLRAVLLMHNATLYSDANGYIRLAMKDHVGNVVAIRNDSVITMTLSRSNVDIPDMATLDIMSGDTSLLAGLIKDALITYQASRWVCELVVDKLESYTIALHDRLIVDGKSLYVAEVQTDFINDQYRIKAWLEDLVA